MANIKKLVLDSLKPRECSILDLSKTMADVKGIVEIDMNVTEMDARTETVRMIIKGTNINFDVIDRVLGEYGVTIRSIDEISVRKKRSRQTN